jgi:3-hydroxyacyl-CoA dehydrogenase
VRWLKFIATMLEKKWLGDKAKQGFYKKEGKDAAGAGSKAVLDWQTLRVWAECEAEVPGD